MKKIILATLIFLSCGQAFSDTGAKNYGTKRNYVAPLIMCLGDSITKGVTGDSVGNIMGYRDHAQNQIGVGKYNFVGPQTDPAVSFGSQAVRHAGVSGEDASQIESRVLSNITTYLPSSSPLGRSVILSSGGNNPQNNGTQRQTFVDDVIDIIDIIDGYDSTIDVYVTTVIPAGDNSLTPLTNDLLIPALEARQLTKTNLYIVDIYTAFVSDTYSLCSGSYSNCLFDGLHPNDAGYKTMGNQIGDCVLNKSATGCS